MKLSRLWKTAFLSLLLVTVLLLCAGCAAKEGGFPYENEDLGFSLTVPVLPEDKITISQEDQENDIHTVRMLYQGETGEANVLSLEEMSLEAWEAAQQEGGPLPQELARSSQGRVVVWYPLQSNPFEPGTSDAQLIDQYVSQMDVLVDSFTFLEE